MMNILKQEMFCAEAEFWKKIFISILCGLSKLIHVIIRTCLCNLAIYTEHDYRWIKIFNNFFAPGVSGPFFETLPLCAYDFCPWFIIVRYKKSPWKFDRTTCRHHYRRTTQCRGNANDSDIESTYLIRKSVHLLLVTNEMSCWKYRYGRGVNTRGGVNT